MQVYARFKNEGKLFISTDTLIKKDLQNRDIMLE